MNRRKNLITGSLPVNAVVLYGKAIGFATDQLWKLWVGLIRWKVADEPPTHIHHHMAGQ